MGKTNWGDIVKWGVIGLIGYFIIKKIGDIKLPGFPKIKIPDVGLEIAKGVETSWEPVAEPLKPFIAETGKIAEEVLGRPKDIITAEGPATIETGEFVKPVVDIAETIISAGAKAPFPFSAPFQILEPTVKTMQEQMDISLEAQAEREQMPSRPLPPGEMPVEEALTEVATGQLPPWMLGRMELRPVDRPSREELAEIPRERFPYEPEIIMDVTAPGRRGEPIIVTGGGSMIETRQQIMEKYDIPSIQRF